MFALWIDDTSSLGSEVFDKTPWRWCRVGPGSNEEGRGNLAEIAHKLEKQSEEVCVILRAADCLDCWLSVPPMNARRLNQAIPFIVEEFVAQPVETMHFVTGERRGQQLRCVGISRVLLRRLLDAMGAWNIRPSAVFPDAGLLSAKTETIRILKDGERALIRASNLAAEMPCERAPMLVDAVWSGVAESNKEMRIEVSGDDDGTLTSLLSQTYGNVSQRNLTTSSLIEFVENTQASSLNLLIGEFQPSESKVQAPRWKVPMALAAILLATILGSDLLVGFLAKQRVAVLVEKATETYMQAYPSEDPSQSDLIRLVNREQGTGAQETVRLIDMLNRVSSVTANAQVRSIAYQAGSDTLDVEVLVAGYDGLDALESEIAEAFREVSMLGATQSQDGVRARLRLAGAEQ